MDQRTFKKAFFALIIGIIVGLNITTIFAGTAYSEDKSITGYGYNYVNLSYIVTDSTYGASAHTVLHNEVIANVPTGYMGAQARLLTDSGQLVLSTTYEYNPAPAWSVQPAAGWYTESGAYYSHGITKVWYGTDYKTSYTYLSPCQNY